MNLLVIGSLNIDLVIKTERQPKSGETIRGTDFVTVCGGKGGNQAIAAAKLGADVSMIGNVGDDDFGNMLVGNLKDEHIKVSGISKSEVSSGVAVINVFGNDNTIIVNSGANGMLNRHHIDKCKQMIMQCDAVLMQFEIPLETVIYAAKTAKQYGKKVIINPAPVYDIPQELLKYTDLLILNEHEASILTNIDVGMDNAAVAAGILCRLGVSEVLITFGRSGSAYFNGNTACIVPAYHVKAVDTTAAGDTYTAAFIIKYNECGDIKKSMKFASAASAIVVTRLGASVSIPARAEVDRFLAEQCVR